MAYHNTTSNYELPQWETSDKPVREDFNEAFAVIDSILAGLAANQAVVNATLTNMEARISHMEAVQVNEINGTPFEITFDTLDGLAVTGVYNRGQARIEF